ncbi:hypothetical protein NIIDMKKI_37450 [Mycobacterium kansasii]|nr:hypothetical protein NIIDMKKI_37450 [Mycobacterium kansasii]
MACDTMPKSPLRRPVDDPINPGRRLRRDLDVALRELEQNSGDSIEWSDVDLAVTLPLIEATADRIEMLRAKLAAEAEQHDKLSLRGVQIAAEVRQAESQLTRLVASLGLDANDEVPPIKSAKHQAAARSRWDRRSHRRVSA